MRYAYLKKKICLSLAPPGLKSCVRPCSGNHERDVPGTGSFFETNGSGGECGVLAETMFYVPAENRAKFW